MTIRRFSAFCAAFASKLVNSIRRTATAHVAREQHDEVSRVPDGVVHLLDEVRGKGDVVVLDEDPVALLGENVGDLARDGGHRASAAQEEVVSLTRTGRQERWCPGSRAEYLTTLHVCDALDLLDPKLLGPARPEFIELRLGGPDRLVLQHLYL
jgi:hypothetical protein